MGFSIFDSTLYALIVHILFIDMINLWYPLYYYYDQFTKWYHIWNTKYLC